MKSKPRITNKVVKHVASLANIPITDKQAIKYRPQLEAVLDYVSKVQQLDTAAIKETAQTTGLTNVVRKDKIDKDRMLSQKEALSNAKKTYQGYFVVDTVFK